jgi:hypothetical protein
MAVVYGEIDSLSKLTAMLRTDVASNLKSFDDLLEYKRQCDSKVKEAELCAQEELNLRLQTQKDKIESHIAERSKIKEHRFILARLFRSFVFKVKLFKLNRDLKKLEKRSFDFIRSRTEALSGEFYRSKQVFESNYSLIQGASGEQQALDELRKLPDNYYVINNFQLSFSRPLYEPRSRQRIYSAQADHIVIAPSGVFLIETKNWSRGTANFDSDFSAFDQVKRTNFALYCFFNPRVSGFMSWFVKTKKIKIRSVLLMTGHRTNGSDRYVKVVDLRQLRNYIEYFPSELSEEEVKVILNKVVNN